MKITNSDIKWLESRFPNLQYEEDSQRIVGELDFCAAYDNESGKVIVGDGTKQANTSFATFLRLRFA